MNDYGYTLKYILKFINKFINFESIKVTAKNTLDWRDL